LTDTTVLTTQSNPAESGSARTRILEQGLALFSVRGFADVSMSEIANAVGITKAALYYHFTGKEELFAHAFANEVSTVRAQIAAIVVRETDLRTAIHDLAMLFLDRGLRDMRRLHQDFESFVSKEMREEIFKEVTPEEALIGTLSGFFNRHLEAGDLRTDIDVKSLIPIVFGMVHAQVRVRERMSQDESEPARSNEEIADSIVEILLYGIVPW
jgi:AcrR family transcriptional regulator